MLLPPAVFDVRVRETGKNGFRIWFPLVLLWPVLFLLVGIALVIAVAMDFVMLIAGQRYHYYTLFLWGLGGLVAETRGTQVHVFGKDGSTVDVDIR